jgi:hypothetical protein
VSLALAGVVTPGNHLIGDGGKAIAAFARRAGIPFHGPCRRRESRHPRRRICTSTTSTPITAVLAVAQPLQRRRHQEPAQLPRLAARSRSLGRQTRTAKLDQRRYRKQPIPTDIAIRASYRPCLTARSCSRATEGPRRGAAPAEHERLGCLG